MGRRPIKTVIIIIITIPVNFAPGRRDPLRAELNDDYLQRPINSHATAIRADLLHDLSALAQTMAPLMARRQ